jgi:hypothetical protein
MWMLISLIITSILIDVDIDITSISKMISRGDTLAKKPQERKM